MTPAIILLSMRGPRGLVAREAPICSGCSPSAPDSDVPLSSPVPGPRTLPGAHLGVGLPRFESRLEPFSSYVTLHKLLNFCVCLLVCKVGDDSACLKGWSRVSTIIHVQC